MTNCNQHKSFDCIFEKMVYVVALWFIIWEKTPYPHKSPAVLLLQNNQVKNLIYIQHKDIKQNHFYYNTQMRIDYNHSHGFSVSPTVQFEQSNAKFTTVNINFHTTIAASLNVHRYYLMLRLSELINHIKSVWWTNFQCYL